MEAQEIATCCRIATMIMTGRDGPRFAQVNLETLFVRDGTFLLDMAKDMAQRWEDVSVRFAEMQRAERESNEENALLRKRRSEAMGVADELVHIMRKISRERPEAWRMFQKMIGKQTLRKIVRSEKRRSGESIALDIAWCQEQILKRMSVEGLEKLLTLRAMMA